MSTLRKLTVGALATVLMTIGLAACGSSSDSSGDGAGGDDVTGKKVTLLSLTPSCATCASLTKSAKDAMEKEGVKVTTATSDFGAAADQIEKFNQALSTNPDAIVIWPTDTTSIIPVLKRAKQSNPDVKVIVTTYKPDTTEKDLYAAFVGVDDKALGADQAQALVDGLKAAGKPISGGVLEIEGAPGAATTILRKQGFNEALPKVAPNLKIVGSQTANWDQTQATTTTSALLSKNAKSDIVGIFAHSDIMLNGAILAATRAGLKPGKDFVSVGIDCDIEGYNNIKAGKQFSTGLWNPFLIGKDTGEVAVKVLKGEKISGDTIVASPKILKDNVGDCDAALAK
jgi:ribose transport system substrate-binding protein